MILKCEECHIREKIELIPGTNLVRFACGNTRDLTREELDELFKKYGGER